MAEKTADSEASGSEEESKEETRSESSAGPSESPKKAKKKKGKRSKRPIPETEDEINSPDKHTLGMLGVLCGLSLVLWAFAHGACNYHPPKETRRPRNVPTAELAREPKDAAIEVVHRWATLNFAGALELAKGPLPDAIAKDKASCDASAADCARKRDNLKKAVLTKGVLLEREPSSAVARVTVDGSEGGPKNYIVRVERDGSIWKATSRDVDDGTFKPKPSQPVSIQLMPAASGVAPAAQPHPPHPGHENH